MKKYIILLSIFILSSCSHNLGTLSLVSTLKDDIDKEYESIGIIKGKDTHYMFMGVPTGFPRIDNAVNDALIKNNASYLTNTKVTYDRVFLFIYFGFMEYTVTGEGWVEVGDIENTNKIEKPRIKKISDRDTKRNIFVMDKELNKPKVGKKKESNPKVKYDPLTGLPIKPTKYDPETGEPIYEWYILEIYI